MYRKSIWTRRRIHPSLFNSISTLDLKCPQRSRPEHNGVVDQISHTFCVLLWFLANFIQISSQSFTADTLLGRVNPAENCGESHYLRGGRELGRPETRSNVIQVIESKIQATRLQLRINISQRKDLCTYLLLTPRHLKKNEEELAIFGERYCLHFFAVSTTYLCSFLHKPLFA